MFPRHEKYKLLNFMARTGPCSPQCSIPFKNSLEMSGNGGDQLLDLLERNVVLFMPEIGL